MELIKQFRVDNVLPDVDKVIVPMVNSIVHDPQVTHS